MDVAAKLAEAHRVLDQGHTLRAGLMVDEAVYYTWDPAQLTEITELVHDVEHRKGKTFHYGSWHDALAEASMRLSRPERVAHGQMFGARN